MSLFDDSYPKYEQVAYIYGNPDIKTNWEDIQSEINNGWFVKYIIQNGSSLYVIFERYK